MAAVGGVGRAAEASGVGAGGGLGGWGGGGGVGGGVGCSCWRVHFLFLECGFVFVLFSLFLSFCFFSFFFFFFSLCLFCVAKSWLFVKLVIYGSKSERKSERKTQKTCHSCRFLAFKMRKNLRELGALKIALVFLYGFLEAMTINGFKLGILQMWGCCVVR